MTPNSVNKLPRQIPYIIGNEACERFSFYGMRNILTPFLATMLLLYLPEEERKGAAKEVFHTFVIGVYFFPLLGGWIADRVWGKYKTIFWLSLLYCVGHLCLSLFENSRMGFYTGLALVAIGAGGIKPCISAFVGDQFDQSNKHLSKIVYDAFYWTINFGSFFASLLMPFFLANYGPSIAFGIPGILMFISTVIFYSGRKKFIHVAPVRVDEHSFLKVVRTALVSHKDGHARTGLWLAYAGILFSIGCVFLIRPLGFVSAFCLAIVSLCLLGGCGAWMQADRAEQKHGIEGVNAIRSVLRVLIVFALITPFWSLFDQKASTWVLQAADMTKPSWFQPAQMQALNPLLVMLIIPFNNFIVYPFLRKLGVEPTPLRRMTTGMFLTGFSWIIVGWLQLRMDSGIATSIVWQVLPYAFLTSGEVLVSATGLEFAYSQAPASMKGTLMSFWFLAVTIGNLWVLLSNTAIKNDFVLSYVSQSGLSSNAFLMFFFALFAILTGLVFAMYARNYKVLDFYRSSNA